MNEFARELDESRRAFLAGFYNAVRRTRTGHRVEPIDAYEAGCAAGRSHAREVGASFGTASASLQAFQAWRRTVGAPASSPLV